MTGFTIQELIISGLYLYEARRILRPGQVFQKKKTNEVMKHLIWVNIFVSANLPYLGCDVPSPIVQRLMIPSALTDHLS